LKTTFACTSDVAENNFRTRAQPRASRHSQANICNKQKQKADIMIQDQQWSIKRKMIKEENGSDWSLEMNESPKTEYS